MLGRNPQPGQSPEFPGNLVQPQISRLHPRESDSVRLGRSLGTCIPYSHKDHLSHPYPHPHPKPLISQSLRITDSGNFPEVR